MTYYPTEKKENGHLRSGFKTIESSISTSDEEMLPCHESNKKENCEEVLVVASTESVKVASRKAFGAQLKRARLAAGLSPRDLARLTGIPYSQLCRMERGAGNPTLDSMTRLAVILDTTFTVSGK